MNANANTAYETLLIGSPNNDGLPDALARIVTAQAQHESANFTSDVFLKANNAFGYKYDGSQYQIGEYNGYGVYASLTDSVAEIVDYIYRRLADGSFPGLATITTPLQYATLLKNTKIGAYFEDTITNYSKGISEYLAADGFSDSTITSQSGQPPTSGSSASADITGLVLLLGLGLGLYYLFK